MEAPGRGCAISERWFGATALKAFGSSADLSTHATSQIAGHVLAPAGVHGPEGSGFFASTTCSESLGSEVIAQLFGSAELLNQYFEYERHGNESIASYLVRESLYFEEFVESLMLLHDEQNAINNGGAAKLLGSEDEDSSSSEEKAEGERGIQASVDWRV